jgi:hypothetical protein
MDVLLSLLAFKCVTMDAHRGYSLWFAKFLHAVCFKFIDIFANVKLVFGYGQAEQLWILGPTGI